MSNAYNSIEPTVIDEDLLKKAINEQVMIEISEVARKEGIDPIEVYSLRLDYKNILKMDNLWSFENLVRLQLDNNIIEKIENIHFLKNLQWLDLSFNNITTIEGLQGLVKLTDLSLYNNRITRLENLDDLVSLNVLSIGNNEISELDNINYLGKFENLRVLNISGNGMCRHSNFKSYVLAHLRRLKYLDYRLVDEESINASKVKYMEVVIAQEEEEKILITKREELKKQKETDALYEEAHILGIDQLFEAMFSEDYDFQKLLQIGAVQINDMKEEYHAKFDIVSSEVKHYVLKRSTDKKEEISSLKKCINSVKEESDKECIKKLNEFQHMKKEAVKLAQTSRNTSEVDDALSNLKESTDQLSDFLMNCEMTLVEQFEDVLKEFERNYMEICGSITEYGQTSFARVRELENEFHERFSEYILTMYDRITKGDIEEIDDSIREVMGDKDSLVNSINASHDFRLTKFDHQEDNLVTGISKDLESCIQKVHEEEYKRNRDRVTEIIAYLDKTQAEIEAAEDNAY